jgi:hypothetical protein
MLIFDSFPSVLKSVLGVPRAIIMALEPPVHVRGAILIPTKNAHKIFIYKVINVNFSVKTDILILYKKV